MNHDEMSHSVELDVTVKAKGTLRGYLHHPHDAVYGYSVAVSVDGLPLDINVAVPARPCAKSTSSWGLDWTGTHTM